MSGIEQVPREADLAQAVDQQLVDRGFTMALGLGAQAIQFADIGRAPRHPSGRHENDAEHSFMLSLLAPELANVLCPNLDPGLVSQFGTVHDLIELKTGDVVTFGLTGDELAAKEAMEQESLERLIQELPPYTGRLVQRYEAQKEPAARFVRLIDKMTPTITNIYGDGIRVIREDFGITDPLVLELKEQECAQRLREAFPEKEFAVVHAVRNLLANHFQELFIATTPAPQSYRDPR